MTSFIILNLSSCQPHSLHYYSTNVFFIQVTYHRKNRRNYVTSSFAIIQIWIIPSKSGNLFWRNYNHNANVYVVFMRFWFFNILQTTCNNLTTKEKNLDWFDFFFNFFYITLKTNINIRVSIYGSFVYKWSMTLLENKMKVPGADFLYKLLTYG